MKFSVKQKRGKWVVHVELGYEDGKRKQMTRVAPENTKKSALELLEQIKLEITEKEEFPIIIKAKNIKDALQQLTKYIEEKEVE